VNDSVSKVAPDDKLDSERPPIWRLAPMLTVSLGLALRREELNDQDQLLPRKTGEDAPDQASAFSAGDPNRCG